MDQADIMARVKQVIANIMDMDTPSDLWDEATSLSDALGFDNLDRMETLVAIEEEFNIDLDDEGYTDEWENIGDIVTDVQAVLDQ